MSDFVPMFTKWSDYKDAFGHASVFDQNERIDDFGITFQRHADKLTGSPMLNSIIARHAFKLNQLNIRRKFEPANQLMGRKHYLNEYNLLDVSPAVMREITSVTTMLKTMGKEDSPKINQERLAINAIYNLLDSKLQLPDKIATLTAIGPIFSILDIWAGERMIPDLTRENNWVISDTLDLGLTVDDFSPSRVSLRSKTMFPSIHSFVESFILLKDEIEEIQQNLYFELEDLINRLFSCDDVTEFLKTILIVMGKIDPYHLDTMACRLSEERQALNKTKGLEKDGSPDTFSWPKDSYPACRSELYNKTLVRKFKLDCACHTYTDDYKLNIMPMVFNHMLEMVAK